MQAEETIGPPQPWLHLQEPYWQRWRDKQFAAGRNRSMTRLSASKALADADGCRDQFNCSGFQGQ
jgi:hypothetical protein